MKKIVSFMLANLLAMSAQAGQSLCGYKDYFHLNDNAHPALHIVSALNEPDVLLQVIGPRSFVIRDGKRCHSGYAHVTVAFKEGNWCVLDIKDGPFMSHPSVKASCNGLHYINTTYDGFASHSYSINFF